MRSGAAEKDDPPPLFRMGAAAPPLVTRGDAPLQYRYLFHLQLSFRYQLDLEGRACSPAEHSVLPTLLSALHLVNNLMLA